MPCRDSNPRPRVFEGLVLEPLGPQVQLATERQQPFLVGTHEVDHGLVADPMPMKPDAAVEGEAHPLAAALELPIERTYWQVMRPSIVAGATGLAVPENRAH
jgi:hypothetical protein